MPDPPPSPEPAAPRRTGRVWLALALTCLVVWQAGIRERSPALETRYRDASAVGMCHDIWSRFFPFYYHYGAFPVAFRARPRERSLEGVEKALAARGDSLVMALGGCAVGSGGEYPRILLYMPAAWAQGGPEPASLRPVTTAIAWTALAALLFAFQRQGRFRLGLLVVFLLGSSPFLLYEVYGRENIFSVTLCSLLLALALNLRFLRAGARAWSGDWVLALGSGVLLASLAQMRAEAAFPAASVLLAYALASGLAPRRRALLCATLIAGFLATSSGWARFSDGLHGRAVELVEAHGGHVYSGPRPRHHPLWHSLCAGLGDFGGERGFSWSDVDNYAWAAPVLRAEYGLDTTYTSGMFFDQALDEAGVYRIKPELMPEYVEVVRRRFLDAVFGDPVWYAGVLARRGARVLQRTSPVGLHWVAGQATLPFPGWLALPILFWLVRRREGFLVKLVLFSAPLSLVPLLVQSDLGATYYAIYHLLLLAIALDLGLGYFASRSRVSEPTLSEST